MLNKYVKCDIHRNEKRHYLNRDKNFNVCSQTLNKEDYFKDFKLYENDSDNDNNDYDNYKYTPNKVLNEVFFNDSISNSKYRNLDILKQKENYNIEELLNNGNLLLIEEEKKDSYLNVFSKTSCSIDDIDLDYIKKRPQNEIEKLKKKNNDIVNLTILKNILNLYFIFDYKNEGYIDLKDASFTVEKIYENNISFFIKNIKTNENVDTNNNFVSTSKKKYKKENLSVIKKEINNKKREIDDFNTKGFGNILLLILKDVSELCKNENVLLKKHFIDIMYYFIKNNNDFENIYKILLYPKNIITNFYTYVYQLKEKEQEDETMKEIKKKKNLKKIYYFNDKVINSNLTTHIKYFKEKKDKKLENIYKENNIKELEECTFNPKITSKPYYLKKKIHNVLQNTMNEKKKLQTSHIIYDIDNTIERTLALPNKMTLKECDMNLEHLSCIEKPYNLKYIIHHGYNKQNKIEWVNTLRNKKIESLRNLLDDNTKNSLKCKNEKKKSENTIKNSLDNKNFILKNKSLTKMDIKDKCLEKCLKSKEKIYNTNNIKVKDVIDPISLDLKKMLY